MFVTDEHGTTYFWAGAQLLKLTYNRDDILYEFTDLDANSVLRVKGDGYVIVEPLPAEDLPRVERLFFSGTSEGQRIEFTMPSDPPTWSRHEPKPVDHDSLIFNPVTREFE